MSAPDNAEYELLTEHFSYPPVSLLDDIINAVNALADRALGAVETALAKIPPQNLGFGNPKKRSAPDSAAGAHPSPEEAAKREIENGTHQLETLLYASIDKNFDKFELYTMRNILTVHADLRPYMQLAHYHGLDFDAVAERPAATGEGQGQQQQQQQQAAPAPTMESITQLRRRLHASQKLHVALETERARNEALLKKLRAALGVRAAPANTSTAAAVKKEDDEDQGQEKQEDVLGFLRDRGTLEEGGTVRPITTTTEFTLSQLATLRSLSSSLRTLIPDMGGDDGRGGDGEEGEGEGSDDEKSWRRERAEYVESASRRYLETVGGVELGPAGEVRDGEWQGAGRGLARGEVEGLEKVVAVLGAPPAAASAEGSGGGGGEKQTAETRQGDESMDQS